MCHAWNETRQEVEVLWYDSKLASPVALNLFLRAKVKTYKVSRSKSIKVRCFPGDKFEDMADYTKPMLKSQPKFENID